MLLNFLWFGLILLAFVSDLLTGMPFSSGMDGLSGARAGLELALTLAGPVCLWSGLSQAMERAGLTEGLCTALRPILRRLFPVCAKDSEGFWNLCGNLSANLLGLGNAATPLGIRTAQRMQALSGGGGASDELCLRVVMNTASLQLIPSTVAGGKGPEAMLENLTELLLPALLLLAGAAGIAKKQDVYGGMLTGAQDGLRLMLSLTPTLVLMLTAVTMLRESGFFALLTPVFAPVFRLLGIPPEVAPLVLIRPLSGSAALAVGTDLMREYGVDSLIGRTAAVMLGSTETTFYTISVYFGAAGVKKTRYALPAALIADLTGFCMAALSVRVFFR